MYDKPKDIINLIKNAIKDDIKNGSLAFLLLTSKSEHYIRDKVAIKLYQDRELRKKRFLVSREWGKRIDLAIIEEKNKPKVLIEFKLCNVAEGIPGFAKEIKKDIGKLFWGKPYPHRFIVFMTLLPNKQIDERFENIVKYYDYFNGFRGGFKERKEKIRYSIEGLSDKRYRNSWQFKELQIGKFYGHTNLSLIFGVLHLT
ncbi:MAG: hypothetical protein NTX01_00565 [Candidatus Omnitrophica bacterium]|nr:hypothetical protein [Candidatus Omnitrophota bacterium]